MPEIINYIREQPEALYRVLKDGPKLDLVLGELAGREWERVYLVGSGTSQNALACLAQTAWALLGHYPILCSPVNFMQIAANQEGKSLGLFLSHSGTTATIVEAVKSAQSRQMKTVAITAEGESPLAKLPGAKIIMPIGKEAVGPKTKGYTASILTVLSVLWKISRPGHYSENEFKSAVVSYLGELQTQMPQLEAIGERLGARYYQSKHVMLLGSGRHYGTACEASLKITEISGLPASPFETEDSLHGRFHGLGPDSLALFLMNSSSDVQFVLPAVRVLKNLNIRCHILCTSSLKNMGYSRDTQSVIGPTSGFLGELDLISYIIPLQFFARALAVRKGRIPEQMMYPGMSQKLNIKL